MTRNEHLSTALVNHDLFSPRLSLFELGTPLNKSALDQPRDSLSQTGLFLLLVSKARNLLVLNKVATIAKLHIGEDSRSVANSRSGLSSLVECLDQLLRSRVDREVKARPVSTGIEDGIKVGNGRSGEGGEGLSVGNPSLSLGIVEELDRVLIVLERLNGGFVERSFATFGGSGDEGVASVLEEVVRVSDFGEVVARRVVRANELSVRGENDKD